ncbi:enduracididine biosynthesis enzyme MppP, partial [Actinoalloteichus caeruleus]
PSLFLKASEQPVDDLEREAVQSYFHLLGQHSYPAEGGRVLSCYSSSVAMVILARALATEIDSVALIHPTFDNIPDLLRGADLRLVPLPEKELHEGDLPRKVIESVGCVFVTTPNNPTGVVLAEERLRSLAEQCARSGTILALDTSFRGFDTRAHYDHYRVLEDSGCRWVVIEDTGKLWPTLDLKVGWLARSENVGLPLAKVYSDVLLGVSPLILALVKRFAEDAAAGGLADLHRFVGEGRTTLRSALAGIPGIAFPDQDTRASVERIDLGTRSAMEVWSAVTEHQVYTLPCRKFHWADPDAGNHSLRVALARSSFTVDAAAAALRTVLAGT